MSVRYKDSHYYKLLFLDMQVKAGAQMLQVFESHAEHLGPDLFMEFCVPYLNQICDRVKASLGNDAVPMVSQKRIPLGLLPAA